MFTPKYYFIRTVPFLFACRVKCLVTHNFRCFRDVAKAAISSSLSVRSSALPPVCLSSLNNLATTSVFAWNFMLENFIKFCLENSVLLSSVTFWHFTQIRKFMAVPRWIVVWSRKVSDESCGVNRNTHFVLIKFVYKIITRNVADPDGLAHIT